MNKVGMQVVMRIERNRQTVLRAGTMLSLLVLASGCSTIKDHRGYLVDPALTQSVLPGVDNRLSVQRSLGEPTFKSQFGQQAWYYVSLDTVQKPFTRPRIKGGIIEKVAFDNAGNVVAVSNDGVEHAVRIEPDQHATPTLGRERSFFEDLFGNIGTVGALPGGQPGAPGGGAGTGPNGS